MEKKIGHVLELVQTCSVQCLSVSMLLSLLHAWLGDRFESAKAYRRFVIHGGLFKKYMCPLKRHLLRTQENHNAVRRTYGALFMLIIIIIIIIIVIIIIII